MIIFIPAFDLAYSILGMDGSQQSDQGRFPLLGLFLVLIFGATWIGGVVCKRIADNRAAPKYLISLMVILGIFSVMTISQESPIPVQSVFPIFTEAMAYSVLPSWSTWIIPLLGGLGVAVGSGLFHRDNRSNEI